MSVRFRTSAILLGESPLRGVPSGAGRAARQRSSVKGDRHSVELQLQPTVVVEPQNPGLAFTHRVSHSISSNLVRGAKGRARRCSMSWFGLQKSRISADLYRCRLACSSGLPGLLPHLHSRHSFPAPIPGRHLGATYDRTPILGCESPSRSQQTHHACGKTFPSHPATDAGPTAWLTAPDIGS